MKATQLVKLLVYNEILRKETFSDFDFFISVNQTAIYLHDIVLKYNCHSMHKTYYALKIIALHVHVANLTKLSVKRNLSLVQGDAH